MNECCKLGICEPHYLKLRKAVERKGSYLPPKNEVNFAIANMPLWVRLYGEIAESDPDHDIDCEGQMCWCESRKEDADNISYPHIKEGSE